MSSVKYTNKKIIDNKKSQFSELVTTSRTPIIELNSSYGTSALRDIIDLSNSGTVTDSSGSIILSTGATANSYAHLDSAEIGRYVPGYGAEIGIGVRFDSPPTGEQRAIWGGVDSDEENGFYFGYDSSGVYVARRIGGTEENKIYQNKWNIDKLDGTGTSNHKLNMNDGNIFQIEFTWYGYGQILFGIVNYAPTSGNQAQRFIPCHSLKIKGGVSIYSPNLRVHTEVLNNATTSDLQMEVGGRQYSIIGQYIPKFRFIGDFRSSVATSTTLEPLISYRRKTAFNDRSIKILGFDALVTTEPVIIQIYIDPTLTGASFGNPTDATASETAVESDTSSTAMSGGLLVWTQLISAGTNVNKATLSQKDVDFDIPNGSIVTLACKTLSGTGTITSCFRLREEF